MLEARPWGFQRGLSAGAILQLPDVNLRAGTAPLHGFQGPGPFLLYTCVGGWGGAWFCLGPVLSLGTGRSLLPLPGEISPSQWGHLTRGGWNVVTWPADPGLIRAEQGHGEKSKQIQPDSRANRYKHTRSQNPRASCVLQGALGCSAPS